MKTKKITITNKEVLDIKESLEYVSKKDTKIWFELVHNIKNVYKSFEKIIDLRETLIDKYVIKDEEGKPKFLEKATPEYDFGDNTETMDKLWVEVLNEKVVLEIYQIKHSDIDIALEPMKIAALVGKIIV